MQDILNNHLWEFIGSILAFLAIVTTIVVFLIQRKRKRLSYEVISKSPLISKKEELKGKLEIKYLGQEVSDVHLIVLEFSNSGNVPIESSDYEKKLNVELGKKSNILSAEIEDVNPNNLEIDLNFSEKNVIFEPVLLNPKDSFRLRVLANNLKESISVDGRIIGVKEIKEGRYGQAEFFIVSIIGLILAAFGMFSVSGIEADTNSKQQLIGMISLGVGYVAMFVALIRRKSVRELMNLYRNAFPF